MRGKLWSLTIIAAAALALCFSLSAEREARAEVEATPPAFGRPEVQAISPEAREQLAQLEKSIAGRENKPAEEVFKNIQLFKGQPAIRVLRIMGIAFGPALGVDCSHCHTPGEWEKDDKEAKQAARKMWSLVGDLNKTLKDNLGKGTVNCYTCHRGQTKPALNPS